MSKLAEPKMSVTERVYFDMLLACFSKLYGWPGIEDVKRDIQEVKDLIASASEWDKEEFGRDPVLIDFLSIQHEDWSVDHARKLARSILSDFPELKDAFISEIL